MIAWAEKETDDQLIQNKFASHLKIKLSLCKDITYLVSRGKKCIFKSLSFGIAMCHSTGNFQVIDLPHWFGHTISCFVAKFYTRRLYTMPAFNFGGKQHRL